MSVQIKPVIEKKNKKRKKIPKQLPYKSIKLFGHGRHLQLSLVGTVEVVVGVKTANNKANKIKIKSMETKDATVADNDAVSPGDVDDPAGGGGSGDDALLAAGDGVGSNGRDRVKGPWSPEEDAILSRLVSKFGARNWSLIARGISGRSGKSCRLRWCNQLDPAVKRKPFSGIVPLCSSKTPRPSSLIFQFRFFFIFSWKFCK